jgi:hypothetical protein
MRTGGRGLAWALIAGAIATPNAQELSAGSVDRVRAALEKPAVTALVIRKPDFFVHVEQRRPLQDIFDTPPWQLPKIGWQPPGVGFDLLSLVRYVAKGVSDENHRRAAQAARDEVQRAIADFCAAQPSEGATVQICSTLPAIR